MISNKKLKQELDELVHSRAPTSPKLSGKIEKIKTGYSPRPIQLLLHETLRRFNVLVCHRRFGKTVLAVNQIIHRAMSNSLRNPQYAYIAPTYKQAKRIAWQYFKDYTMYLPNVKANSSELILYIDRPNRLNPVTGEKEPDVIKIMLIGADDPDDIRGLYLDGAVLDEYAQCDPIVWGQIIRPALADRKKIATDQGIYFDLANVPLEPWAIFIGTPKGQNHFFRRYQSAGASEEYCKQYEKDHDIEAEKEAWEDFERHHKITEEITQVELKAFLKTIPSDIEKEYEQYRKYIIHGQWFTSLYKASETGVLPIDEIEEMTEDLTEAEIEQELECSFTAAILGSYYGQLMVNAKKEGRIGKVPYDPRYPVETFWDIGVGDKTTIWFRQKIGGRYHYIDYYEMHGVGLSHYHAVLEAKSKYVGGETEIDEGEIILGRGLRYGRHVWPHDGKVQEFGSGQTRQETARTMGLTVFIQPKQRVEDRINASRNRIKISWFDEEHCSRGLECLYNYQKEYDSKLLVFKKSPKHDWSSHGSDSFGYSSLDDRDAVFQDQMYDRIQQTANTEYDELEH